MKRFGLGRFLALTALVPLLWGGCGGRNEGDCDESTGRCGAAHACPPGKVRCNEEFLIRCNDTGDRWDLLESCATADSCDAVAGRCRSCDPGTLRCDGPVRETCADDGYSWTKLEVCDSSAICNGEGCFPCQAGELRCSGDGSGAEQSTELQRCTDDEEWEVLENCETDALCQLTIAKGDAFKGTCAPPACTSAGELQCFDNVLKRCSPSLTKWAEVDTCETSELCEATVALATDPDTAAAINECEEP